MFKESGDSSPESVVEKVERAAASSRSRIRRERAVRESQSQRPFGERGTSQVRDGTATYSRSQTRDRNHGVVGQDDHTESLEEIYFRNINPWATTADRAIFREGAAAENTRRRQAGEELLRDALQYQRPSQRMRVPRSPRTSALRFEVASRSHSSVSAEERAIVARSYMPTPPASFSDNDTAGFRLTEPDGPVHVISAEPTPGFAPAQGVHPENGRRDEPTGGSAPRHYTPPGESSWTALYPPLRRVTHLSPRLESRLSRHGGLGDRRRSVSSSSSEAEQDTWETLLTTMEPDAQLPSTESSFTSTTASQSNRQSYHSWQTPNSSFASSATAPLVGQLPRAAGPPRDYSDSIDMPIDINSGRYDCLSIASHGSMRLMLEVIQRSRQSRASHGFSGDAELTQQQYEGLIIYNYFRTLTLMDNVRAQLASQTSRPPAIEALLSHRQSLHASHDSQQDSSPETTSALRRPASSMAQDVENDRDGRRTHPVSSHHRVAPEADADTAEAAESGVNRDLDWGVTISRDVALRMTANEMSTMQRVIERMARREDISDGWWAAVGLSRTVRENR